MKKRIKRGIVMLCEKCGKKTKVVDSRTAYEGVFRKRKCAGCGRIFYTEEYESEEGIDGLRYVWAENTRKNRLKSLKTVLPKGNSI